MRGQVSWKDATGLENKGIVDSAFAFGFSRSLLLVEGDLGEILCFNSGLN